MKYNPDRWTIVRVRTDEFEGYKVLAGWMGGYLDGDRWRLSSNIVSFEQTDYGLVFHNESGSQYACDFELEGMSSLMYSVYEGYKKNLTLMRSSVFIEEWNEGE